MGLGVLDPWKLCRRGQSMFLPSKMSHSFIQNCCWITLQVSHHEGWKIVPKWKVKLIFEAPETVWWRDLVDLDPSYFTTGLRHCYVGILAVRPKLLMESCIFLHFRPGQDWNIITRLRSAIKMLKNFVVAVRYTGAAALKPSCASIAVGRIIIILLIIIIEFL